MDGCHYAESMPQLMLRMRVLPMLKRHADAVRYCCPDLSRFAVRDAEMELSAMPLRAELYIL